MKNTRSAIEARLSSYQFYRDRFRLSMAGNVLQGAANLGLVLVVGYLATHQPLPQVIGLRPDGSTLPIIPLDQPSMPESQVKQWAVNAVTNAFTFDFKNFRAQLSEAESVFTDAGRTSFEAALTKVGTLDLVQKASLVVTAQPTVAPSIGIRKVEYGHYEVAVQFKMLVTYANSSDSRTQNLNVTAWVVRVPTDKSPNGVLIAQLDMDLQ